METLSKEKQIEEMEMAEMLEIIENARETYANDVTDHTENEYIREGLLNARYRKQSGWINVEERLPHWSDGKVLVFTKYGFSICERTVNSRWQGQHANWITHWMPLPEAPKMRKEDEGK